MVDLEVMSKKIDHNVAEKCTGCKICTMVCSLYHEKDGINPRRSRISILSLPERMEIIPMVCHFCEDSLCVKSCPVEALSRDEEKRVIVVDDNICNSCGECVEACPYGAMTIHPVTNIAMTCDRCDGNFWCVKYCPKDALEGFVGVEKKA